ncbi:hypothetical protein C1645_826278 [Glomus cerebriforme]|uniref:Uncharacterized protein n=1 Tax=Glomus cerebriforme TaxID=658196 RepID=A0A397SXF3_9GLOM|nr:hypothetical protein C1645_826278 [Glomus cerebriforme]
MSYFLGKDKTYEEYEACLTTTVYGDTYLDSEKCKPEVMIKSTDEEEEERIRLSTEWIWIDRKGEEKGFRALIQQLAAKV